MYKNYASKSDLRMRKLLTLAGCIDAAHLRQILISTNDCERIWEIISKIEQYLSHHVQWLQKSLTSSKKYVLIRGLLQVPLLVFTAFEV